MVRLTNLIKEVLRTPPPRLNTDKLSKEEFEHLMIITGKRPMSVDKILDLLLKDNSPISLDVAIKLEPQLKLKQDIRNLNEEDESKKKDCNCGCNTCENVGNEGVLLNESVAPKQILSENLQYHVHNKLPLTENTFRYGSQSFINLWAEARSLYLREIIHVNDDDKEILEETDLGNYGMYEGKKVPLGLPMENIVNEDLSQKLNSELGDINGIFAQENIDVDDAEFYDIKPGNYIKFYIEDVNNSTILKVKRIAKANGLKFVKDLDDMLLFTSTSINEAAKKKKKKDPPIGKPKRGGPKAYYVYVRDPKTKRIKKVTFGSGGLKAKINNPKARQAFAARHKCAQKKDRTKASYWSCRLPRYAKLLGLKSSFSGFW